ncbi:MAG: DUF1446 domain-containing protein [Alphaproteobacteria bacterium]|nr:DUF1446 domain-containing protein [Alphaproteobacteria bacterium]
MPTPRAPIRIASCSGFYGDRLAAARELVEGGPLDVLTGDWLAELTMLLLVRERAKRPEAGYARTFLAQLEQVLGTCVAQGTRIVSNAGGVNPHGLADAVRALAEKVGVQVRVAVVTGDAVAERVGDWLPELRHLDTGRPLQPSDGMPIAANVYLGARGIAEALARGADIVLTGRTTDAAAIVGPAAWWHGWAPDAWDALAGALVAGHVVECGTQATGGNYSFFEEVPGLEHPGFPVVEIAHDGSAVVTKHPGTGGLVDVGTVTAQLLYEIGGPAYLSPDVVARFDTVQVAQEAPDRVRVHGVRGEPPPSTLKLGLLLASGFRNDVTFLLGGDRVEAKAALLDAAFWGALGGKEAFAEARTDVIRGDHPDAPAPLRLSRVIMSARDPDGDRLGKPFGAAAVELALASVPGLTLDGLPGAPRPTGVFWPALVDRDRVEVELHLDGERTVVSHPPLTAGGPPPAPPAVPEAPAPTGRTRRLPLGTLAGARSGDKAGNANVGFWVRQPGHVAWLLSQITEANVRAWLGGFEGPVRIHPLPNLRAVNVELVGWLGAGVLANLAPDPQAKCLAEALRTVEVDIDEALLS